MDSAQGKPGAISGEALSAAALLRGLGARRLGRRVDVYPELDSTNRAARALAQAGEPEGAVVIAETQSRGRGRMGRHWVSPPNCNLYISFLLRPALAPAESAKMTLLTAVALVDTLTEHVAAPRIKWPNDILLGGRKVAGVLSELACEGDRTLFVIVGIGVNLNYPRALMPPEIRERATSVLEESGAAVDRVRVTRSLMRHMDKRYIEFQEHGFAPIARGWNRYARMKGCRVRAHTPDGERAGRVRELDGSGFLVLECEGGRTERVVSGDVFLLDGAEGA